MSAIVETRDKAHQFDGIRRYKTRCKVRIDSHNGGAGQEAKPIWLHESVLSVQTSKDLKGTGQASVALTPSQNWLNLLFPNDYINIYFDIDDGQGWTRTFFGFIDRIEETYQVGQDGKPQTRYHIACSDFMKAFERTQIYFNPHLMGREDFASSDYAAPNIAGLGLATKGVEVGGSPSDIVQNVILITMGFGTQFHLPPSYTPRAVQNRLRRLRAEVMQGQLSESARQAIERAGGSFERLKEKIIDEAEGEVSDSSVKYDSTEGQVKSLSETYDVDVDQLEGVGESGGLARVLADKKIRDIIQPSQAALGQSSTSQGFTEGAINVLEGTTSDAKSYLLDIVDTLTFVERRAIDGFVAGSPVWQRQGSVLSIIRSLSHEAINEMFFDLRPLSADDDGSLANDPLEGSYAREDDDALGNRPDDSGGVKGITHIPALVMREYPFSTIDGLDLRDVNVQIGGGDRSIGILFFGAIFSDKRNKPGRHIVKIPNINIADRAQGGDSLAMNVPKHLDVAVVRETEIMKTQFGRSDAEHYNLFEFYSDHILGSDQRFYMHDLLPIITPIHITRHGLRVRSVTTRFARFSLATHEKTSTVTQENIDEAEESGEEEFEPGVVSPGDVVAPVTVSSRFFNGGKAKWGYRRKETRNLWAFHQGIDIVATPGEFQGTLEAIEIPVRCIADGEVVVSAPEGVWGGYGDVVIVKHRFEGISGPRYSVYAHLSSRAVGWHLDEESGTVGNRPATSATNAPGVSHGQQEPIPIRKGDPIGTMGNTGTSRSYRKLSPTASNPNRLYNGVHLHFEIDRVFPPRNENVTPRLPFSSDTDPEFSGTVSFGPVTPASSSTPPTPAGQDRSFDPVEFFQSTHGVDLESVINEGSSISVDDSDENAEPDDDFRGSPRESQDENRPKEDVLEENNKEPLPEDQEGFSQQEQVRGAIDSSLSRSQIIRWALLQDHWYQHNLEYLSGKVEMRGAPEIRAGYRLDLYDRDLSFYVEGVNHSWTFPDKMQTSLSVTRGQPNNPYPHYVLPKVPSFNPTEFQRKTSRSRLATYFLTPDVLAVRRATTLNATEVRKNKFSNSLTAGSGNNNHIDDTIQDESNIDETYNEHIIPSNSREARSAIAQERLNENREEESNRIDYGTRLSPEANVNPNLGTGIA